MRISHDARAASKIATPALCVFASSDPVRVHGAAGFAARVARALERAARDGGARRGSVSVLDTLESMRAARVILAGVGSAAQITPASLRDAAGAAARRAHELGASEVALAAPEALARSADDAAAQVAEGARLALYSFARTREPKARSVRSIRVLAPRSAASAVRRAAAIAEAVVFARDAANLPPNECPPAALARIARSLAGKRVSCRVVGPAELRRRGFGGISAVGGGSSNGARLIELEYRGAARSRRPVLLVGKAVTFDTGGISLKPGERMSEMKFDKCGGCAVLGAIRAMSLLRARENVVALVPAVENMPDGGAYRPGDIVTLYSKKTAEIANTDAEGRLILADALAYGEERHSPRAIIDMATLTGACVVALGADVAGLFSTSDELASALERASARTGERIWRMPLDDDYDRMIDSKVADMKNMGIARAAGAIAAAAFLRRAVRGTPWAHIDIAGTAWTQQATTARSYNPDGATGFGVRLLADYLA